MNDTPTRDTISIPRGTCKTINVTPKSADGTPIELSTTDTVVLTVRELASPDSPILLQAESAAGTTQIQLHEDETTLPPGKYSADIRFKHAGCTFVVWGIQDNDTKVANLGNFIILVGVGVDE